MFGRRFNMFTRTYTLTIKQMNKSKIDGVNETQIIKTKRKKRKVNVNVCEDTHTLYIHYSLSEWIG